MLPTSPSSVPGLVVGMPICAMGPSWRWRTVLLTAAAITGAFGSFDAFKEKFAKIGDEPAGGTPEDFAATIKADSAKWGDVVRRSGAKLE